MFGLFLIFCALFLLLGLLSFDSNDPSVNYIKSGVIDVKNKAGLFGAYAAGFLNDFFGLGALICPCVFAALGFVNIMPAIILHWWRWAGLFLLTLCLLVVSSATDFSIGDLTGGGMVGDTLELNSIRYLSPIGSFLLWLFVLLTGIQLAANFSWISLSQNVWRKLQTYLQARASKQGKTAAAGSAPIHSSTLPVDLALAKAKNLFALAAASIKNLLARLPEKKQAAPMPVPHESALPADITDTPKTRTAAAGQTFQQFSGSSAQERRSVPVFDDDDPFAPSQDLRPGEPSSTNPFSAFELHDRVPAQDAEVEEKPVAHSEPVREPKEKQPAIQEPPRQAARTPRPQDIRLFKEPNEIVFPSPELLNPPKPMPSATPEDLEAKGRALMACFNDFDVQGELARITPGPVVTMFEVRPAPGIRVSKIANLADDLSLALKAVAVRIQAPIPGSDTVGIEIPNDLRETVNFRELVESPEFKNDKGSLTMILGKNIAGHPFVADLTRMPHMLVAGATGAGKSVCLNSILVSLLYRMPPSRMRLLLVDPKRIELAVYADLPHLVHPVVTEMDDAKNALEWAVQDMKNRYKTFERMGVRNIVAYHQKLSSFGGNPPPGLEDMVPMPYLVIVIDELADLMMTAAREVETSIVRLAQLARAAGIHMILATQRPSVDVVTGLIKANFPCRISFQVTSKHDSRTILDQIGAEHLLGRGDMLFKPSGGRLLRLHGPFLSDEEVQTVASHWKAQMPPDYQVDFSKWSAETTSTNPSSGGDATSDALYGEAREFVLEQGRASISLLQRRLKIGFNRAARLMEQFESDGIIGPADGSKPRNVIR